MCICFKTTNNGAEYEAIISGVQLGLALGAKNLLVKSDSQLVVGQIRGEFQTKSPTMAKYLTRLQGLLGQLDRHEVRKVPRIINQKADLLAKLASERAANPDINIHFARLLKPSYNEEKIMETSGTEGSWFSPILRYLKMGPS